jgi:hypothetical protein
MEAEFRSGESVSDLQDTDPKRRLIACREFSWPKLHANGVIHKSPGSEREAVATPGGDEIVRELQGSSTDRPDHPETILVNAVDASGGRPRSVELASEFRSPAHIPRVAARTSPYPGLLCMTPLASEYSRATTSTPIDLTRMRTCGASMYDALGVRTLTWDSGDASYPDLMRSCGIGIGGRGWCD